jgi:hypothetical protein
MRNQLVGVAIVTLSACGFETGSTPTPAPADPRVVVVGPELEYIELDRSPFRVAADGWRANREAIDVHHDGAALRVTPLDDEALVVDPLVLAPAAITIDGTLASGAQEPLVDPDGLLVIPRSAEVVEHLALRGSGLEQSWRFTQAADDVIVRIAVTGYTFVGKTATGLHFASPDGLGFVYSDAQWTDAHGESFLVAARWDDGEIVLEVPAGVLEAGLVPTALTATIAAEREVDAPIAGSPTGYESRASSIAFSGGQFLAVWQDLRNGQADIYGSRLSTAGVVLDTQGIKISTAPGPQLTPTVAVVGGSYLVVWEDRLTGDLQAATVSALTAAVTQLGVVASTAENEIRPRLAGRGNEALLVYQTTANDIGGVRFAGGAFGAPFVIANTTAIETEPTVAANPTGDYLVAFTDGTIARDLRGQLVNPAGALVGARLDLSASGGAQFSSSLGFSGGNFIAVWANNFHGLSIHGARVSPTGTVIDTRLENGVTVGGIALTTDRTESLPSVACSTGGLALCFVAWRDSRAVATAGYDIYGRMFTANLAPASAETPVSRGAANQVLPFVSQAGASFFVGFSDLRDGNGLSVCGTRVTSNGVVMNPEGILIARGFDRQVFPAIARSSSGWLYAWSDSRVRGPNILGTRVNNAAVPVDAPALTISNAPSAQVQPAVAVSSLTATTEYMVVWSDSRTGDKNIVASRVPQTGPVLDPNGIAVTTVIGDQIRPEIASEPSGRYLVVWQDRHKGTANFDIYGAVLDVTGQVIATDILIATAGKDQSTPVVAFDSTAGVFLVVWADARNTISDLYATRVTTSGVVLDFGGVVLVTSNQSKIEPALAFGSDRFLLVWREGGDVRGTRVQTVGGITTDPTPLTISAAPGKQTLPSVIFLEDAEQHFAVVWADERSFATSGSDIFSALVNETTAAVVNEQLISANPENETRPTFSRGKVRKSGTTIEVLVGYQRLVSTVETERAMLRKITYQP